MVDAQKEDEERQYKIFILPTSRVQDPKTGLEKYALTWAQIRAIIEEERLRLLKATTKALEQSVFIEHLTELQQKELEDLLGRVFK